MITNIDPDCCTSVAGHQDIRKSSNYPLPAAPLPHLLELPPSNKPQDLASGAHLLNPPRGPELKRPVKSSQAQ